ncbi:S8 family serine peptidase, partial [Leptotrichia sp. oral taxon 215]|uniref:S8 family serine peptidase n=1 Tax=Leptotrichia sp. oral taxon 215 TaxID=712359 RepID=UPI000560AD0C
MKKIILLISLISVLASCGGDGGGGGSAPQTTSATPVMPTPGSTNTGNGNTNGTNTGNNNGQAVQPQNPVPAPAVAPQVPTADNRFAKPVDSRETTGQGVKVGVLDSDFLSRDVKTEDFHRRIDYEGFLQNDTFAQVINDEFGSRMTAVDKVLGPDSTLSKSEHGLIVATILAGRNGNGAKGASVYGVSFGESGKKIVADKSKYEELYNSGVRIFNQSFGTAVEFSDYNSTNYRLPLRPGVLRERESTADVLDRRIDELNNFYKKAVNNGALFIWAAGNTTAIEGGGRKTYNAPTIQAGMPAYISELHKGWIAVVGIKPDGTEYNPHLARAGAAMWWSVSANGNCELEMCSVHGSSFAAPRVTAAAVKVKEKFPWMTGHELKQTLLTTAKDLGQPGVDTIFGWGLLDETKALKGPAQFNSILIVGERASNAGLKGQFNASIGNSMTSIFENDISGDAGLLKSGNGTLILTGNNSYMGNTTIDEGKLEIYGNNTSDITINHQGTLVTYPTAIINDQRNVNNNGGTLENKGSGAVITGDYTAGNGAVTKAEIGTKLTVRGTVNLNGDTVLEQAMGNRYITAKGMSATVIEAEGGVNGQFAKVEAPEMIEASVKSDEKKIDVIVSRKNVEEYVS